MGTITNKGTITLTGGSNANGYIDITNNVTLTGGGKVTIVNGPPGGNAVIQENGSGLTLTNTNNTIQGNGIIGNGGLDVVNGAAGTISSNAASGSTLLLNGSGGLTNNGTLQVSAGDLLHVTSGPFTNFAGTTLTGGTYNVTGTLEIDELGSTGGEIVTNAANIILNTAPSIFEDSAGKDALLNLSTNATGSSFTITGGRNFSTNSSDSAAGNFTNNGTLTVGASNSTFKVNGNLTNFSGTTLTGGTYNIAGTFQFNNANIVTNAANITLTGTSSQILNQSSGNGLANFATNASTGKFTVAGGRVLTTPGAFTNSGSFTTTGSGSKFTTGGNFINSGTFTTTGGDSETATVSTASFTNNGALTVASGSTFATGGSLTNFSGTTLTGGTYNITGTFQFNNANIVTNAANITLTGTSSQILNQSSGNGLANFAANASTGTFTVAGGRVLTTPGAFTNSGGFTTTGSGSKFTTGGNFINSGTFTTTGGDSETATVGTASFTNNGTLTVASGSTFATGGSLTNFSGTTLTGGIYNITGTFQFNNANIVTNAANITLTGTGSKIVNQSMANGIANFTTNAAKGSLTIAGGRVFTPGGVFSNAGSLTLTGTGSKFTSSVNLANTGTFSVATGTAVTLSGTGAFTQTAGKTTDDGTITASSVTLNGGTLFGRGFIVGPLQSSGIITPADSATTAGALTITGNYKQNAGGVLDIAIGGTTAGTNYDQLKVSGTATVGGTLNLSRLGSFVPTIGTQFDILTGGTVTGTFSTVTGTAINGSEHFSVTCDTTDCDVAVVSGAAVASGVSAVSGATTRRALSSGVAVHSVLQDWWKSFPGAVGQNWQLVPMRESTLVTAWSPEASRLRRTPLYLHELTRVQAGNDVRFDVQTSRPAVGLTGLSHGGYSPLPVVKMLDQASRAWSASRIKGGIGRAGVAQPLGRGMVGQRGVEYHLDVLSLFNMNPAHLGHQFLGQQGAPSLGYVLVR
jgi:hypothetical protein